MNQIPPIENDKEFEKLIRDICRNIFNEPSFELYGRRGEAQNGIDGDATIKGKIFAFQCKKKDVINIKDSKILYELKLEMREDATKAHRFYKGKNTVEKYIFASTYKNTKHLQDLANSLTEELGFPIIYWGWDTISEYIQQSPELIKTYFSQFIFPDINEIEKTVWFITKSSIKKSMINDERSLLEKSLEYYKINDNEQLVFEIVCNNLDIPNSNIIHKAKETINNLQTNSAFWITGDGGTGKTSILIRLAVEYAMQDEAVFFINFENPNLTANIIPRLLTYIENKTNTRKAFIFIDNPDFNHEILEFLLRDIVAYDFEFFIIFTERTIRLELLKKDNIQYAIYAQNHIDPLIIANPRSFREKVYQKLYQLIGQESQEIWKIMQEIGVDTNLAFVNATYRILYQLNQKKFIHYDFDWVEYENMAKHHFSSFINGFRYIALFYLFEIKTPLSLLIKIFNPPQSEIEQFKDSFKQTIREPLIVIIQEKSIYNSVYFYRTKHEIISELYFEEKGIDKNQLLADIIRNFDENEPSQVQTIVNLFGSKRNIQQCSLNFKKLLKFCFSDEVLEKLKRNSKLYETLFLSQFWTYRYHDSIDNAIHHLEQTLTEFPHNLHYRTELAKIYQHQDKYEEAEKILMESLVIDNKQLHPRTELAKIYQHQDKYEEAEKVLKELLDLDKKNLQARTELAKIYQHQDKYEEAEKVLKELLDLDKKNLQARTELAKIYQHQDKYEEAEKILMECVAINPKDLNSRTELAKIYQQQGEYEVAKKVLKECISLNPKDLNSRTELSKIYQHQDKYEEAEKILKELLDLDKKNLQARTELAKIYQHQDKYEEAEKILEECVAINPKDLNSRTELAKIYQHQDKYEEAEKVLMESLVIDNKQLHPRTELAKIYQHQDKYEEAEKVLMESLVIDNKQLHPRTELAKIYQHQDKYEEAEKVLMESLVIDNKQLHPRTELAKIYQHQDKYEEAEKVLMESLVIDNKQLHPRTELAKIYQHQDKYEEAEKVLMESLVIDNKQLHPRTELAKIYQHQDKYEEAEKVLMESLVIDNKQLHPRTELAKIYQHQDKYEEAEKVLKELLDLDKKNLQARTELAKIYQHQDKYEEAEKVLKELLDLDKKNLQARTELAKIYQHQDKYEEAEKVLKELLDLDKKNLQARTELAKIYQHQDKYEEAEKVLLEILDINRYNCYAVSELISVYSNQKNSEICYQVFEKFLKKCDLSRKRKKEPQAMFNNIFKFCSKFNHYEKAKEYFDSLSYFLDDRNIQLYYKLFGNKR